MHPCMFLSVNYNPLSQRARLIIFCCQHAHTLGLCVCWYLLCVSHRESLFIPTSHFLHLGPVFISSLSLAGRRAVAVIYLWMLLCVVCVCKRYGAALFGLLFVLYTYVCIGGQWAIDQLRRRRRRGPAHRLELHQCCAAASVKYYFVRTATGSVRIISSKLDLSISRPETRSLCRERAEQLVCDFVSEFTKAFWLFDANK